MIAIIGDIIKSRRLTDRQKTQQDLRAVLERINHRYEDLLASRFTITLGDEFQGVLKTSTRMTRILDEIAFALMPIGLRFGIGVGKLSTELDPRASIGADGPAYWAAREAIAYAHKNNDYGRANIHLYAQNEDVSVGLINEILKLTSLQVSGWRDSQIEVFKVLLEHEILDPEQINHQQIAQELGILTSSLTRRLESSGIKRYLSARIAVELAVERINERDA